MCIGVPGFLLRREEFSMPPRRNLLDAVEGAEKNKIGNGEGRNGMRWPENTADEAPMAGWDSAELRREFALDTAEQFVGFILRCAPELLDLYVAQRWQTYECWTA